MPGDTGAVQRSRRRALARAHHPDLGGDADAFVRAMAATTRPAAPARIPVGIRVSRRRRTARLLRRRLRSLTTTARARLPRSVPGARRYVRL